MLENAAMWLCVEVSDHPLGCTCGACDAAVRVARHLPKLPERLKKRLKERAKFMEATSDLNG